MDFLENNTVETTLVDIPKLLHIARYDDLDGGKSWLSVQRSLRLDANDERLKPFRHILAAEPLFREEIAVDKTVMTGGAELAMYAIM